MRTSNLKVFTFLWIAVSVFEAFLASAGSGDSCQGRCGSNLDSSKSCQCNSHCERFGDCCFDYYSLCTGSGGSGGSCGSTSTVSADLWNNDVNGVSSSQYTVNYQTQVPDGSTADRASQKLLTNVNEGFLSGATYKTFMALLDNYDPYRGSREQVTSHELSEDDAFLNAILGTKVMDVLLNYLTCEGIVTSRSELKSTLKKIWFDLYPRSGTTPDSSGFEHVLVGEYKSSSVVGGFHSWLSFYDKEKNGDLNYYGYVSKANAGLVGAAFNWNSRMKALGSFFIGVSPEFDVALYTLCYLTHPNTNCPVTLNGHYFSIQTYDKDGHIATAFARA